VLHKVLYVYNAIWYWDVREHACRVFLDTLSASGAGPACATPAKFVELLITGLRQDICPRNIALCTEHLRAIPEVVMRVSALAAYVKSEGAVGPVSCKGGVTILLNVLRRCGHDAAVCEHACAALLSLAPHGNNRAFINKSRGIPAVLSVFVKHPSAKPALSAAIDLLAIIVQDFPNHQTNFRTHNGPALLKAALTAGLEPRSKSTAQSIQRLCAPQRRSERQRKLARARG